MDYKKLKTFYRTTYGSEAFYRKGAILDKATGNVGDKLINADFGRSLTA